VIAGMPFEAQIAQTSNDKRGALGARAAAPVVTAGSGT
jgi:hypothetical protein